MRRASGTLECAHWDATMPGSHASAAHAGVFSFAAMAGGACTLTERGIRCGSERLYALEQRCVTRIWREDERVCGSNSEGETFCVERRDHRAIGPLLELGVTPESAFAPELSVRCHASDAGEVICQGGTDDSARAGTPSKPPLENVIDVAAGRAHFCALTRQGRVYCWGRNDRAQLGGTGVREHWLPVAVALPRPARALAAGPRHSCAALDGGATRCWGDATRGEASGGRPSGIPMPACRSLGKQTVYLPSPPHERGRGRPSAEKVEQEVFDESRACLRGGEPRVLLRPEPHPIGGARATLLAAGGPRTCAADETGKLLCWGGEPARFEALVGSALDSVSGAR
jgi:hypothetical protein